MQCVKMLAVPFCVYMSMYATADDVLRQAVQARIDEKLGAVYRAFNPQGDQTKPANPNIMVNGVPVISLAIKNMNIRIAFLIADAPKFDANVLDDQGMTPLMYAVKSGYGGLVTKLLGKNARVYAKNKKGDTALDLVNELLKSKNKDKQVAPERVYKDIKKQLEDAQRKQKKQ